jgi:DNA mismatch repair protein MutL
LANKIAAGEVVQRPASALKELVENSLDAGARRICADLEGGGARRIRVLDDGAGMSRDDALLAFERHATSKIASDEDLEGVTTLGFRGEALPSIAAVSKITLTTRRAEDGVGTQVCMEGGRLQRVIEMGAPAGTEVDLRSLFFNVPARRKFLKTRQTEIARCVEVVTRAAMAHPEVAFRLRHGDRTHLELRAGMDARGRVAELLGKEVGLHLLALSGENGEEFRISGWAGAPTLSRSGRDGQFLFVNGRPVRDRLLVHAVYSAYHTFLPRDRHPYFVLFVDLPVEGVDVNVHPAKEEVRFRRASTVYNTVREAVTRVLGAPPTPRPLRVVRPPAPAPPLAVLQRGPEAAPRPGVSGENGDGEVAELSSDSFPDAGASERLLQPPDPSDPVRLSECRYLGQWEECFLLFAAPQGLVFLDQHAAHERVLYNRFRDQFREGRVERQACLVPPVLSLRPEEALRTEEHQETLERSGFELEAAGPGEYLVRAVPALLADRDPLGAVRGVIEGLAGLDSPMSFPELIDGVIARMSCRSAIKAARTLHPEEVAALVKDLEDTSAQWTCPHGRPVLLALGSGPVRRRFLR